jgi:hypothetical protein
MYSKIFKKNTTNTNFFCHVSTYIMIQVYKEAFKAGGTSLRARRIAECF